MALFSRTKKAPVAAEEKTAAPVQAGSVSYAHILHTPRITEKASRAMEGSIYVFDVTQSANKRTIRAAIQAVYKVTPRKVRIVNVPVKSVRNMRTGQRGFKGGGKKAYVYLKRGDTITIT